MTKRDGIIVGLLLSGAVALFFQTSSPSSETSGRRFSMTELALPVFMARLEGNPITPRTRAVGGSVPELDLFDGEHGDPMVPGAASAAEPRITSGFGFRRLFGSTRHHNGIDVGMPYGTPILAHADGAVTFAGRRGGYGLCVIIDHGSGRETLYAHASRITVSEGDYVYKNETIAEVGSTGRSFGNHLHFEIHQDGVAVDPEEEFIVSQNNLARTF